MTRIKSFQDLIAVWSTNVIGWIFGWAMNDFIEVATLIKEIAAAIAFGFGIYISILTIRKFRKDKREKNNKR